MTLPELLLSILFACGFIAAIWRERIAEAKEQEKERRRRNMGRNL